MEEFSPKAIYSSGWKRLCREENDYGMNRMYELSETNYEEAIKKNSKANIMSNAWNKPIQEIVLEKASIYEKGQKDIIEKIIQLQNEVDSMKELLKNIHLENEIIKDKTNKNKIGSKLSGLFK